MEKKNNTLIKVLVILGSIAAIFVAVALIYRKYNKKKRTVKDTDPFDFDDDFFFDDCEGCYDGDGIFDIDTENVDADGADDSEDLAF